MARTRRLGWRCEFTAGRIMPVSISRRGRPLREIRRLLAAGLTISFCAIGGSASPASAGAGLLALPLWHLPAQQARTVADVREEAAAIEGHHVMVEGEIARLISKADQGIGSEQVIFFYIKDAASDGFLIRSTADTPTPGTMYRFSGRIAVDGYGQPFLMEEARMLIVPIENTSPASSELRPHWAWALMLGIGIVVSLVLWVAYSGFLRSREWGGTQAVVVSEPPSGETITRPHTSEITARGIPLARSDAASFTWRTDR
jgi:hypothetical protein